MPDLIRHPPSFTASRKGRWAPDQVRADDLSEQDGPYSAASPCVLVLRDGFAPGLIWRGVKENGGRCRHRPPLVPALTAVAGWRGHLSLGGFRDRAGKAAALPGYRSEGREAPFGTRWVSGEARSPSPIPVGSRCRVETPPPLPFRFRRGRSPAGSKARIGAEAPPVAFTRRSAEASRPAGASRSVKRRWTPSGRGSGREAVRRLPAGSSRGAIPAAFPGPAGPPGTRRHLSARPFGSFVKPARIRLRSCGRGFVRSLAFRLEAPTSLGERRRHFGSGLRPSVRRVRFRSASLPATSRSCQLRAIRGRGGPLWITRITGVVSMRISRRC
jgi:hypothetical protein